MPGEEGILGSRNVPARVARQDRARRDVVLPLSTASPGDAVTAALQAYADRGVFRGFRATPGARGRVEYQFTWLFRRPMRAVFDPRRGVLTFAAVFPGAGASKEISHTLRSLVAARARKDQPAHKRIDARRARVSSAIRKGDMSLVIQIRGENHDYAVRRLLNLINELFLSLHDQYPDYLIEHFGLSPE